MTLDELLAREGIRDTIARYNAYGDSGKFELLWNLFAEDAVMEIGPVVGERTTYTGLDEIKSIFTGAQGRVQDQAAKAGHTYVRHFTATHQIDLVDAEHATGRCYFAVILPGGLDHWGRYVDEFRRVDGEWKFQRRKVHVDGSNDSSWFAG